MTEAQQVVSLGRPAVRVDVATLLLRMRALEERQKALEDLALERLAALEQTQIALAQMLEQVLSRPPAPVPLTKYGRNVEVVDTAPEPDRSPKRGLVGEYGLE